ncbi:PEP-CTERM sorting domain-containing protein [Azohydromonas aeria]|uniref:PEP-CTERM sorting domain-containing protein n=1 Tax=Azohydromonas aeria TaxID=2590212 RepID=UPI0012FB8AEA|nr:PEP-CTERM sorting domain-containing protein [Azohydromonas aeria]
MKLNKIALAALALAAAGTASAANLVVNGDFEQNMGPGMIDNATVLQGWDNGAPLDGSNRIRAFNFVVNAFADSAGFSSELGNITIWGPANGVNNGFTGSNNGGYFVGGDGGYAWGWLTQEIQGLTIGQQYSLSFEWAQAQFTDARGAHESGWQVQFGGDTVTTGLQPNADQGFGGWRYESYNFTATSTSQTLGFLAIGTIGYPPFSLLDDVRLEAVNSPPPPAAVPEPASLALVTAGLFGVAAVRRRRQKRG